MTDLFGEAAHDPGGKVSVRLPLGVRGTAEFSPCGRYRHLLTRDWGVTATIFGRDIMPRVLWIGCNPSTASAEVDDPTMIRIRGFTDRLGYKSYAMCNVMDYRATNPKALLEPGVIPFSRNNAGTILEVAGGATFIIAAWGSVHPKLRKYADYIYDDLRGQGYLLSCLGTNRDGSPKHPLYVKGDAPLVRYRP
jgi:hypothetical protein